MEELVVDIYLIYLSYCASRFDGQDRQYDDYLNVYFPTLDKTSRSLLDEDSVSYVR
jgi:hypothetical protein